MALQSLGEALRLLSPAEEWLTTDEDLTRFPFPLGSMTVLMTAEETDVIAVYLTIICIVALVLHSPSRRSFLLLKIHELVKLQALDSSVNLLPVKTYM